MNTKVLWITVAIVVIVVAIIFGFKFKANGSLLAKADTNWRSVFLDNGQVYFGHLKNETSQYAILTDVYYLQVDQQTGLQPTAGKDQTAPAPKVSLIKLGSELHGPRDEMKINRDHIIFAEDLKDDSKVVTAINDYIKNPKK